ncbi:DUF3710 domain-containing protein [Nocardia sp. NPDC059177]|uniref:DUF3710 domain-containing protein n=1 Tax=Nocardia sp. NPDC059177 TaxID=3346759 RepID=UPI0036ADEED2
MFGKKKRAPREDEPANYDESYDEDDYAEADEYDLDGYDEDDYDTDEFPRPDFAHLDFDDAPTDERIYGNFDHEPDAAAGPYDISEVSEEVVAKRLDLGSVLIPVPQGGQLQVEMSPDGTPQAVHLATEHGRLTVAAYAAPKSAGQWRTVAADLAESLRGDGASVAVEKGPWGREVKAITEGADLRFIGVDGPRWMIRLVAAGPSGAVDDRSPLITAARAVLADAVVRRGSEPLPVRDPLPVVLPQELAEQLAAAHQQQVLAQQQALAAQAAAAAAPPPSALPPQLPDEPRRGADGSAMQQLGLN